MQEIFSGWITKQGGRVKSWKRRWAVLNSNREIRYFISQSQAELKGVIDLSQISSFATFSKNSGGANQHNIMIETPARTWTLSLDSMIDLDKWALVLENVCGPAKRLVTSHEGFMSKTGDKSKGWKR
eukprot:75735_1